MLILTVALLLITAATSLPAPSPAGIAEPALSAAEIAAVNRKIATLHSPVDRSVAHSWSNSKKIAELLCKPAGTSALKKQIPGIDRVFLGTDDPTTLALESNQRLIGSGTAKNPQGWQDFSFTCDLDPTSGKVTRFFPILTPSAK